MTKQYISDIITTEEMEKWKPNDRILITAQTGSGKSHFIKNELYNYCLKNNKRILLLSNRTLLKRQNEDELGEDKLKTIKLHNYQTIESFAFQENNSHAVKDFLSRFDYIVMDEFHYTFQDSGFNRNSFVLMEYLNPNELNKIFIFITATPQVIFKYQENFDFIYSIETDYSYIDKIYFYSKREVVENIIRSIPENEKIIYFGKAIDAFEISRLFDDSSFICSEKNKQFKFKSDQYTIDEIVEKESFTPRLLCSTKVLDNGINIFDKNLKHIIVEMIDPIDIIQCLGRRRIDFNDSNDKITIYLKLYNGKDIYNFMNSANKKLLLVEEYKILGKEKFQREYARKDFDNIIQNDFEINYAKFYYNVYIKDLMSKFVKDKEGFIKIVSEPWCFNGLEDKFKSAENNFEKISLESLLEFYSGRRLYKGEELDIFRDSFFEYLFAPKKKRDIRNRGYRTINEILIEDGLQYRIVSETCWEKGNHRGKVYWKIIK